MTSARRAIVTVLAGAEGHLDAEELTARVQATHPDVHEATVYRVLGDLEGLGLLERLHTGARPAVFALVAEGHHHDHLVCRDCRAVIDIPAEVLADVRDRLLDRFGFGVGPGRASLLGRCRPCTSVGARRARSGGAR